MTKRWFTSDLHLGHKNIIKYCDRPFKDVDQMNDSIIENWNAVVAPKDTVYVLGDVMLGPKDQWGLLMSRLMGRKVLIVGNHDAIFKGEKPKMQERFADKYSEWFDEVHHNLRGLWLDDGTIVDLSHFPHDGDSHDGDRYTDYRLPDTGRVLIHGHTHAEFDKMGEAARVSKSKRGTLQIHVGVDAHGYAPVSEDEVIDLIQKGVR